MSPPPHQLFLQSDTFGGNIYFAGDSTTMEVLISFRLIYSLHASS